MPSRGGLPGANRFTTAMQSEAQPGQNMQHFERGTSLACKPCPVVQIRPEGKLLVLPVTRTEQVPECWRSFPDWEGSADGDSPVATFGGPYWSVAPSPVLRLPEHSVKTRLLSGLAIFTHYSRTLEFPRNTPDRIGFGHGTDAMYASGGACSYPQVQRRMDSPTRLGLADEGMVMLRHVEPGD